MWLSCHPVLSEVYLVVDLSIFISSGILLIQLCGVIPGATYYWLPVVPLITLLIYVVFMPFTKETPRWFVKARRIEEARSVLSWLRGNNYDVDKELKEISEKISKEKRQFIFKISGIDRPLSLYFLDVV